MVRVLAVGAGTYSGRQGEDGDRLGAIGSREMQGYVCIAGGWVGIVPVARHWPDNDGVVIRVFSSVSVSAAQW